MSRRHAEHPATNRISRAFDRYCQFQDDGAFEMAKVIENKGRVVEFQKKKK